MFIQRFNMQNRLFSDISYRSIIVNTLMDKYIHMDKLQ